MHTFRAESKLSVFRALCISRCLLLNSTLVLLSSPFNFQPNTNTLGKISCGTCSGNQIIQFEDVCRIIFILEAVNCIKAAPWDDISGFNFVMK